MTVIKKHGHWWVPSSEQLGLKWFENPRGERPEVCDAAIGHCKTFDIAMDCGAHVGTWMVNLWPRFQHIHGFEPILTTWMALAHNLEERKVPPERVTPHLSAVGDISGNCRPTGTMNATMSSHIDPNLPGRVPVIALDDRYWGHVSLIKIDVEGCEYHVLKGAARLLEYQHPTLVIEWKPEKLNKHGDHLPQIETMLAKYGYRLAEQLEIDRVYV